MIVIIIVIVAFAKIAIKKLLQEGSSRSFFKKLLQKCLTSPSSEVLAVSLSVVSKSVFKLPTISSGCCQALTISHITPTAANPMPVDISYYIALYHIISHQIISFHITLDHVILHYFILYYIILYYIILYQIIIILYHIVLYYIISYYIILYYIILDHIILHHIILYYIILYHII